MNKDIKKKWLKALRSGEYKQGVGQLIHRSGHYCCLGVLCDQIKDQCESAKERLGRYSGTPGCYVYDFCDIKPRTASRLMDMNDKEQKSFKQIASYISKNL